MWKLSIAACLLISTGWGQIGIPLPRPRPTTPRSPQPAPRGGVNRGIVEGVRTTDGILRHFAGTELVLEAEDRRLLYYRIGNSLRLDDDAYTAGDHLRVTHVSDEEGIYTATDVEFLKAGTEEDRERASAPVDLPPPRPELTAPGRDDTAIARAREAAAEFLESLPRFQVRRNTTRYVQEKARGPWRALDVVTAVLVYREGNEAYTDIQISGKKVDQRMTEIPGLRSTGEFGETLRDLLDPESGARFGSQGTTQLRGRRAWKYRFEVPQERSNWRVAAPSEHYFPGYAGAIWVDTETARVLRIELEARDLPRPFPFDTVEMNVDYDFIRLEGGRPVLLPTESEALNCIRGTSVCMRNATSFRNYVKFDAESGIVFEDIP